MDAVSRRLATGCLFASVLQAASPSFLANSTAIKLRRRAPSLTPRRQYYGTLRTSAKTSKYRNARGRHRAVKIQAEQNTESLAATQRGAGA